MNGGGGAAAVSNDGDAASKKYQRSSPAGRNKRSTDGSNAPVLDKINLSAPIADLFPYCTVSFADIAGFTAWSSTREPAQVFVLLQSLYQAFDLIAKRRQVFKVETIGDSYLAVTGLPKPQSNHALIMARYVIAFLTRSINKNSWNATPSFVGSLLILAPNTPIVKTCTAVLRQNA